MAAVFCNVFPCWRSGCRWVLSVTSVVASWQGRPLFSCSACYSSSCIGIAMTSKFYLFLQGWPIKYY
jgi:hypothetical protein